MAVPMLVRHTVRGLVRSPFFTITAVLSLAIGIGANTAIFTAANALLFAPTAGVAAPERLVDIGRTTRGLGFDTVSYPTYRAVSEQTDLFGGVYAVRIEPQAMSLGSTDGAERVYGEQVSASYFDALGLRPAAGTFFTTEEDQPDTPLRKVVLSHGFWTRRFAADRSIVGTEVTLSGDAFIVTGVAPAGFGGMTILSPDLWLPLTAHARSTPTLELINSRESVWLSLGARLAPGVSIEQARQALSALTARLQAEYPDIYRERGFVVEATSRVPGQIGQFATAFLGALMGLVDLVQLVACTNLAGLILARTTGRAREVAVRLALGASRRSLVSLLLAESLTLFAVGAALALVVSRIASAALASILTTLPVPIAVDLAIDWRVLAFTAGLALVTGLLTGLVPALQSTRVSLAPELKADAMAPRRRRLRHAFVAAQVAACFVLVALAGLFFQALGRAGQLDTGMTIDGVDVASITLSLSGQPRERWAAVASDIRTRLAAIPGVVSVGAARMMPLQGGSMGLGALRRLGDTTDEGRVDADWNVVTPGYFRTIGVPIVRGRDFTDADERGAARVAVVSERLAELTWPGDDPIGRVLEYGDFRPGRESSITQVAVIGVARNAKYRSIGEGPLGFIYLPLGQYAMDEAHFFMRRDGSMAPGASLEPATRAMLRQYDRNLPLVDMASFRQRADVGLLPQRIASAVAGLMGVVALILAAIGIYGVTAFAVASRTREIGVRVALGADPGSIRRLILAQALRLTAIGGGIGMVVALGASQLVRSFLFGLSPADPLAFGITAAGLASIALGAGLMPAVRAARVDPAVVLRSE